MDINEAPTIRTNIDIMRDDIKKGCQEILNKNFEGREYDKEKFSKYKDYCFDEIPNFLNGKYICFGFVISFIALKEVSIVTYNRVINRNKTDGGILVFILSKQIYRSINCILSVVRNKN